MIAVEKTQRIIVGIGGDRRAFDFTRHITELPPHTGDEPAVVLPMKLNQKKPKPR